MSFGLASPQPLDQVNLGMAPTWSPAPASASAPAVAPPQASDASPPVPQSYKPSMWDIAQGVIFDGQSPAEAAMAARQRAYQAQTLQQLPQLLSQLPPGVRAAALMGGPKVWDELAKNWSPQTRSAGQETDYFGGSGKEGGYTRGTDTYGVDDKSGQPFSNGPARGFRLLAPSLGGDFSAKDGVVVSGRTGQISGSYETPQSVAPGNRLDAFLPGFKGIGGAGAVGASPGAASPSPPAAGRLDPMAFWHSFVRPHEGGFNPSDANGSPTNMGVNQSANPSVDVKSLTDEGAGKVFGQYFQRSGAASMPPALAAVHSDTYFISPKMAQSFLQQSGGDPQKYLGLRDAWMTRLEQADPNKYGSYATAWTQRNADLGRLVGSLSGQQGGATPGGPAATAGGGQVRTVDQGSGHAIVPPTDPAYTRFPAGTVLQRAPTGELSVVQRPEYDPSAKSTIRDKVLNSPEYTQAKNAMSAYQAMVANAGTMTGPSAYSMLDTFARAINPGAVARPTVIETIEKNLGLPAQLVGSLESKFGQGNLPPQVRQQIIDAVVPFAQAHWDQANMLNQANAALAKQHGFDAADVTAPLEARPERVQIAVPPPGQRRAGTFYVTPKGPMKWTGSGWLKQN